jgi:predicted AlkP superfamily phosphohydrolase/phosphomutase
VIGLDGATYRLIDPLVRAGQLPNLARFRQTGTSGVLQSTIQPSSEQAWSSFMTGQNNGKHGVFGFQQRLPGTYLFDYVNARSIRAQSLWQMLSQRGRDVIVINVPMTYPPQTVRGVLIGGLLSPGVQSRFTYPDDIYQELRKACGDYRIDVDIERGRLGEEQLTRLVDDAVEMIHLRTCATRHLAKTRPWDFLMVVYGASDRLAHKLWKYWDPNHALYDPALASVYGDMLPRIYRELDAAVGTLLDELVDEQTTVFIVSDHGFGPMEKAVYLNRWLAQNGYLAYKSSGALTPKEKLQTAIRAGLRQGVRLLDNPWFSKLKKRAFGLFPGLKGMLYSSVAFAQVDWSRTQAYAVGTMGNIYLNLRGREPMGIVDPGAEASALQDKLIADLQTLRDPDTGQPVFHTIYRGADLYSGPYAGNGPDIVGVKDSLYHIVTAEWQSGDDIVVRLGDEMHFASDQSGQHELDGVLMARGAGIRQGETLEGARLVDMAPTILYALGEPVPDNLDGRVLTDLYAPEHIEAHPPRTVPGTDMDAGEDAGSEYDEEEARAIRERLTSLGYLD